MLQVYDYSSESKFCCNFFVGAAAPILVQVDSPMAVSLKPREYKNFAALMIIYKLQWDHKVKRNKDKILIVKIFLNDDYSYLPEDSEVPTSGFSSTSKVFFLEE